jgi:hypothetical protein
MLTVRALPCLCTGLKSLLLEKRVEALSEALEMKEAQLGEVLAAAHLDPATVQQVGGGNVTVGHPPAGAATASRLT